MLTRAQVFFVAVFTQALLYGIYLATLIQCFRWLIFDDEGWKPRKKINLATTFATIFILLMLTINFVTAMIYELNQYIRQDKSWYQYGTVMAMVSISTSIVFMQTVNTALQDISSVLAITSIDSVLVSACPVQS